MIKSVLVVSKHLIYGGTEKHILNLVNALAERGVSVALVTGGGPLVSYISPKVNVFFAPISRKERLKRIAEREILRTAATFKPQVIHSDCRTSLVCSQLARDCLGIPVITHEHHMYDDVDYPYIVEELKSCADKIVTIGPYTSRKLIKYGIEKERVATVLNGVDIGSHPVSQEERDAARRLFNLEDSDKVVVCLSRIVRGKGIDKLVLGFANVAERVPGAKLIIAGDDDEGYSKAPLGEIIKANNLQKKVFLYPGEYDIRKFHAIADVFCYPAICKGMAVMEAMAAGLPIVGKKTIRKPLVVEDKISGLMTEATAQFSIDPGQLAEKITYLFKKPVVAKRMGMAARKRIEERFTLDKTITKILSLYRKVEKGSYPRRDKRLSSTSTSFGKWSDIIAR